MRTILKGATDQSVIIRIVDATDGTPETGVTSATGGLDLKYRREGAATANLTESDLSALTDAHSDGGMLHIGAGYYRIDVPDAAFATGANGVLVFGTVTGMVVIGCYLHLVDYNPQDAVRLGLTALPNAAAEAAGGLYTRGSGAGQIAQDANGRVNVNVAAIETADPTDTIRDAVVDDATRIDASALNTLSGHDPGETIMGATDTVVLTDGSLTAAKIAANAINAAKLDPDVTTELQAGLATAAALATVDTVVDAIQAKTDNLPSDPADASVVAGLIAGVDAKVDIIDGIVDDILVDTAEIGAAGAGLTNINLPNQTMDIVGNITGNLSGSVGSVSGAVGSVTGAVGSVTGNVGGNVTGSVGSLAAQAKADVNAEADAALVDIHLDHLLAAEYDPQSKPGAAGALLNEMVESDNASPNRARFTAGALEQAPTGGSAPTAADIADAVWEEPIGDHSGTAGSTAEQLAAAGSAGDPWATSLPGSYTSGQAGKIVGDNLNATVGSRATQTSVDDLPTNAELATALAAADDAVLAAIAALNNLSAAQAQTAAAAALTAYDPPTRTEATSDKDEILVAVADVPTNAELATALAAADDAVLAAIAALNNLSQANIRTAVGLASANLDTQLADLPTNAELATALAAADDAVLAAIAALNNLSAAQVTAAVPTATQNADALLKRDFSAVTGEATRSALNALRFLRNKWTISGGALTVKKEDDATDAWTGAVTQTAGNPVSEIDPA